jgi:pyruvate/2-oxoglutarate dehydrogenase complex dihydrolipoamide acyltransferase (E2) component
LKLAYDQQNKRFANTNKVVVASHSFKTDGSSSTSLYDFTKQTSLANIHTIKTDQNSGAIPLVRVFDYSLMNVSSVDELVVPPALISLTINRVNNRIALVDDKVSVSRTFNINLTAVATAFEEEVLSQFLENIKNTIENPFSISL